MYAKCVKELEDFGQVSRKNESKIISSHFLEPTVRIVNITVILHLWKLKRQLHFENICVHRGPLQTYSSFQQFDL